MRLHRKPPFVPFCAPQRLPVRLRVPTGHLAPAPRWPKDPPTPQLRHSPTVAVPLPLLPHPTHNRARQPPARPSSPQPFRRHATKVPSRRALARRRLLLPRQPPPRLRLRGRRATRRPANDPTPPALVRRHPKHVHRHSRRRHPRCQPCHPPSIPTRALQRHRLCALHQLRRKCHACNDATLLSRTRSTAPHLPGRLHLPRRHLAPAPAWPRNPPTRRL